MMMMIVACTTFTCRPSGTPPPTYRLIVFSGTGSHWVSFPLCATAVSCDTHQLHPPAAEMPLMCFVAFERVREKK